MNALPTATACALPHGQAHGIPRAIQSGSVAGTVHAKRSEVKGPEVKTPDLKGPEVKTPDLKGPEVKFFVGSPNPNRPVSDAPATAHEGHSPAAVSLGIGENS